MGTVLNEYEVSYMPKDDLFNPRKTETYFAYSHEVEDIVKTVRPLTTNGELCIFLIRPDRSQYHVKTLESYDDEKRTRRRAIQLAKERGEFDRKLAEQDKD